MALCYAETEELPADSQICSALKSLLELKSVQEKNISNPNLFRGAPIVTIYVRLAGSRTKGAWKFLEKASQADIRLAEFEHPSPRKMMSYCSGRVPIYIHPCFSRSRKLRFPLDVGGLSRDGRVNTDLDTGSLWHAVDILTPDYFRSLVDSE